MITLHLVLVISIVAFVLNTISFWALGRITHEMRHINERLWSRIHYLEMALGYHDLVPMPWEMDDFDEHYEEIKKFKRDGNVVYLQNEE